MIFQYAKSTDPAVIEAVEFNRDLVANFRRAGAEFAAKYGDREKPVFFGSSNPTWGMSVSAISSKAKPTTGQWTKGYGGRGWRPFKTSPVYAEMIEIGQQHKARVVPGVPEVMETAPERDGTSYWLTPNYFIWEGVAYFALSRMPDARPEKSLGEQWEEILPSAAHLAWEAFQDSLNPDS